VTDARIIEPVLLLALAKQGIAESNVELWHDYAPRSRGKEYSPYAQHYRDISSGKRFAVVSGLPMVDAYGQGHELVWTDKNGIIDNGNNIFHSIIDRGNIRILALSDQPTGAKKDDELTYHPQLFVGGIEVKPLSDMPKLLEADPVNENYAYNTLEWDYGICWRRLRLIEGRFLGSWVFIDNPQDDVLIKYNQSGKLKLRLQYAKDDDTEYIPKAFFDAAAAYPVVISDSATFYPDANPETATVDGRVWQDSGASGVDWATIVAAAGTSAADSTTYTDCAMYSGTNIDKWRLLGRAIFLFDTSSLGSGAEISAVVLSLRGNAKNGSSIDVNIYSSAPASNTALAAGDFDSLGSTAFSDTINISSWSVADYNDFGLNSSGIAAINKTGVSKFGSRDATHDAGNSEPSWTSTAYYMRFYCAEQGNGYKPKLVVTYSVGVTEKSSSETGSGAEAIASGSPINTMSGAETGSGVEMVTPGSPIVVMSKTETGSGLESLGSRSLGQTEAGYGLESLGSRELGQIEKGSGLDSLESFVLLQTEAGFGLESLGSRSLGQTEMGSGLESLGSRDLGQIEAGSGLDIAFLLAALAGYDLGSGVEAALKIAVCISADTGSGSELSRMLKDALAGDGGGGYDALKTLIKKSGSGSDMRLTIHRRQVARPHKEVSL
jgi:hypothetical protein